MTWIRKPAASPRESAPKVVSVAAAKGKVVRPIAKPVGKWAKRTHVQANAPTKPIATAAKPRKGPKPRRMQTIATPYAAAGRATAATPMVPARITESVLIRLTRPKISHSERFRSWLPRPVECVPWQAEMPTRLPHVQLEHRTLYFPRERPRNEDQKSSGAVTSNSAPRAGWRRQ